MRLKKGDRVALVSPASQMRGADVHMVDDALSVLADWGLVVLDSTNKHHHFYLAGTDLERFGQLETALTDDSIKAIFCMRGGYGSPRLYPLLNAATCRISPKFLVGYSDITALHLAAAAKWPTLARVHGPNIATSQFLTDPDSATTRESLRSLLFEEHHDFGQQVEVVRAGVAKGPIEGGCLSLVISALGSPFEPKPPEGIAFLEDTGEAPYKIDRMLTQLKNAGYFELAQGIVFGQMAKCSDPHNDLKQVIADVLSGFRGPIVLGLKSGHGDTNRSIQLGADVKVDGIRALVEPVVQTLN